MSIATINIQIDSDVANIYKTTSPKDQAKIRLLISLLLREFSDSTRTLETVMDEIGERATSMGLTEEKLRAMLDAR
jgi:hypothetical protein